METGEEDVKKGTQQLEIIQIDIQMSTIRKDNKRLKQLYEKSKTIKSAIPHPLTKGAYLIFSFFFHIFSDFNLKNLA